MKHAFAYGDSVYLNRAHLLLCEGVSPASAEPLTLPPEAPPTLYRVDDGTVLTSLDEALKQFRGGGDRLVVMTRTKDGQRYSPTMVMESALLTAWRAHLAHGRQVHPSTISIS